MFDLIDLGLVDYDEALNKQLETLNEIHEKNLAGKIIFCSHPHTVTLGRKTQPDDVFNFNGRIFEVSRGGRATYHGPSQLVVYPIINLNFSSTNRPAKDIGKYLRLLEQVVVNTLNFFDVKAEGKFDKAKNLPSDADKSAASNDTTLEDTGVWVGSKKIASIGIAVKKWITYHGIAINLDADPEAFQGLNPCGYKSSVMINLETLTNKPIDRKHFQEILWSQFLKVM